MIIPIGVDCGIADFCKKHNFRTCSLPFDWLVSYNGVSKCIENEFKDFLIYNSERINKYDLYFHHDFLNETKKEEEETKYKRRIERFKTILETSEEELIFCRKGHAVHHHEAHNKKYLQIKNEIEDAEDLERFLSIKYPNLKYKIIVMIVCGICFNPNEIYSSQSKRIEIYNIASPVINDMLFENCARKIFLHK